MEYPDATQVCSGSWGDASTGSSLQLLGQVHRTIANPEARVKRETGRALVLISRSWSTKQVSGGRAQNGDGCSELGLQVRASSGPPLSECRHYKRQVSALKPAQELRSLVPSLARRNEADRFGSGAGREERAMPGRGLDNVQGTRAETARKSGPKSENFEWHLLNRMNSFEIKCKYPSNV